MSSEVNNMLISPSVCICGIALQMVTIEVKATTGNVYNLYVAVSDTIDYMRRIIAKKTKLSKDRIVLLYKDRQLREGSLDDNYVRDGAKLHLVPSVETGLLSQRPEQSVMQALESLNDSQITDFLSGKAPLNLTMRLGDHMMLIQLQLSTVSPIPHHGLSSSRVASHHYSSHHHTRQSYRNSANSNNTTTPPQQLRSAATQTHQQSNCSTQTVAAPTNKDINNNKMGGEAAQARANNDSHQTSHNIGESIQQQHSTSSNHGGSRQHTKHHHRGNNSSRHHHHHHHHHNSSGNSHHYHPYYHPYHFHYQQQHDVTPPPNQSVSKSQQQPTLSSSRATGLFHSPSGSLSQFYYNNPTSSSSSRRSNSSPALSDLSSSSCTSDLPPRVCSHTAHEVELESLAASDLLSQRSVGGKVRGVGGVGLDTKALAEASRNLTQTLRQLSSDVLTNKTVTHHQSILPTTNVSARVAAPADTSVPSVSNSSGINKNSQPIATSSTSKTSNERVAPTIPLVAQDLSTSAPQPSIPSVRSAPKSSGTKQRVTNSGDSSVYHGDCIGALPSSINGNKNNVSAVGSRSAASISVGAKKQQSASQHQGAIIESMQHHGKGVFSGTFSGTLNPALQDRHGRPKRDISTIIHILNDLLCATPHYSSQSSSSQQGASAASAAAAAAASLSQSGAPSPTPPKSDAEETLSAEDAATRSRVEQVRAMLQQRAERRKARRLAKTTNSAPYVVPSKTNSSLSSSSRSTQHENVSKQNCISDEETAQHLMRSLMCSGAAAVTGEVMTAQTAGQQEVQEYENEQHSIEQVENTFSVASKSEEATDSVKENDKSVENMEVSTLADVDKQVHGQEGIKISRESNHDQPQSQDEQRDKKQQQQTQDAEQDAAKMVSLNSGAVVA